MQAIIPKKRPLSIVVKLIIISAYVVALVSAIVTLARSAILPTHYFWGLVALSLFMLFVVSWLLFWNVRRGRKVVRTLAFIIAAIGIVGSLMGLGAVTTTLGVLDKISEGGTVALESKEPFYVFISGIDTYGDIGVQSRSDVNILAGVNPKTSTITLVTVPRDSYLPIALGGNDQYDKLTHAGNYGVESSMKTVGNLFGVDVDAYVRINFTSFIKGIDKLGGVTVHNPVAFESSGEVFPSGDLYLTGEKALIFSRERMSLAGGDVDRGQNQQRVISAIVAKASALRSIDGIQGLIDLSKDSIQTNLTSETVRQLINQQIQKPVQWQTNTLQLNGVGETGTRTSYAMPSAKLYMFILDEDSVELVRGQLHEAMNAH